MLGAVEALMMTKPAKNSEGVPTKSPTIDNPGIVQ